MITVICDDNLEVTSFLEKFVRDIDSTGEIHCFTDAGTLVSFFESGYIPDVLLLDIDLGNNTDGMKIAEQIRAKYSTSDHLQPLPLIIFITGMPERMPDAFNVHAYHFITKPIDRDVFSSIFKKAMEDVIFLKNNLHSKKIMISIGGATRVLSVDDILCIESQGRKLIFYTNDDKIESYGNISDISGEVGNSFYPVHRSYLVNMAHISNYDRLSVSLDNRYTIPMSRNKYKDFIEAYIAYISGGVNV